MPEEQQDINESPSISPKEDVVMPARQDVTKADPFGAVQESNPGSLSCSSEADPGVAAQSEPLPNVASNASTGKHPRQGTRKASARRATSESSSSPQAVRPTSFNLITEPWIPRVGQAPGSLREVFSFESREICGGSPLQKVALFKIFQAIAQSAWTPENDDEWRRGGPELLAQRVQAYLATWHDRFDLYGERPFLQMPAIAVAKVLPAAHLVPHFAGGNTTVLFQSQCLRNLSQAELALLLVTLSSCALSGKKTDNSVVLSSGYLGKSSSGRAGPAIGFMGMLHSFLIGRTLLETAWLNLMTREDLELVSGLFPEGLGVAPWEEMPEGEDCSVAQRLKKSLMGRLVPLSRFCLISQEGQGLHYSEGVWHADYKEGVVDPTVAMGLIGKTASKAEPKVLWCRTEKRPWRELVSLLSVLGQTSASGRMSCFQLDRCLPRACQAVVSFSVWSGGASVSSNAGEQYFSGDDDLVESSVQLTSSALGQAWFQVFSEQMMHLDFLSTKILYGSVSRYSAQMSSQDKRAATATQLFWQAAERQAQALIEACDGASPDALQEVRRRLAQVALDAFDLMCPANTAREIDVWSKTRPNLSNFILQGVAK